MSPATRCTAKVKTFFCSCLSGERWKQRQWLLRFYGAGDDRSYLERLAEYDNVAGKVEFCGHVSDIRSIWADNHLLVMPSRAEGTPLALVEAMICGRPSVVTDVGGNAEWIDEPSTGFVAEAPSARSLNDALERAWEARGHWESIGQRAHQVAVSKADPEPGKRSFLCCCRSIPTQPMIGSAQPRSLCIQVRGPRGGRHPAGLGRDESRLWTASREVFTDIRWVRVHGSLGGWTPAMAIGLCAPCLVGPGLPPLPGACR